MVIKLNEIERMSEYDVNIEKFICDVEETDDYMDMLENIAIDSKHIITEYLKQAIECGFDEEIMVGDYCIPEDFVEILKRYQNEDINL